VRRKRLTLLFAFLFFASPASRAHADWLIIPFLGSAFGTDTNLFDLESSAGATKKLIIGGSTIWLTDGFLGLEGDFSHTPGSFERDIQRQLVTGSSVTTLVGNVVLAAPLSVTRESLRPYFVSGLGFMHAGSDDFQNIAPINANLLAFDIGGGAIGFVSNRAGVRFDLRHTRSVRGQAETITGIGQARLTRLSFWRASVGVVIRY
jgi:hypothetical protein